MSDAYRSFLEAKVQLAQRDGFTIAPEKLHPWLKPHAGKGVAWALDGGRRAIFASFGLAKTSMQLEWACQVLLHLWGQGETQARALIEIPLGVRQEFFRDAGPLALDIERRLGMPLRFVKSTVECWGPGLYLSNHESVRERTVELAGFDAVSIDEAACLRGMGGTKLFRVVATDLAETRFRLLATATPSPNEYIELLAYAEVLGVMDIGQAKTRFFRRNSEKADQLTLHPHKEREFWMWVASWALFITKPSDVGCSDEGYDLPPMTVRWHELPAPDPDWDADAPVGKGGQIEMFSRAKIGVVNQARVKRDTLVSRVARMAEICAADPDAHRIVWHDLNDERDLIGEALPGAFVLDGSQDDEVKEARILGFSDGLFQYLAAKPVMAGAGCNFQRHCRKAVFVGVGFKFHDFIQAVHRIYRFGQTGEVEIDVIYSELERDVRAELERRWAQHKDMVEKMAEIIREYGLSCVAMADQLKRSLGVERVEAKGQRYSIVNNDCVLETQSMGKDSVDLIVSSIPFSTQYEYSPRYEDFGHTDSNEHFWEQMDHLIPQLLRILKPGRDCCIHVKDRIVPGGLTGLGFQTLYPFGDDCRAAFRKHGFAYIGKHYNTTDVVRENNQTYRLGYSEQLKDGSRQGAGVPEEILIFRKPPSDRSNGYADTPVVKARPPEEGVANDAGGKPYSLGRWQLDAHGYWKSSGDRLLKPEEWLTFENMDEAYKLWKGFDLDQVYDYEQHVLIAERFHAIGKLPSIFMLLPPHSWHADVWTDVAQMRSLNTLQGMAGAEKHLCPLPFDIVERLIRQRSMEGELVFDPFAGLGTVPYCALKLGRRGAGSELNPTYWAAAAKYCEAAELESRPVPTLFDAIEQGVAA